MIERISILLHFPGDANPIDVSSLYRDGTSHFAERLFNEDKHSVQDTFSCALKHDQGIVNKFRSARGKIRIVVLDASDGSGLFSGVIEPSAAQASHQVNEDLVLEAVDATWRLDDPVAEAFQFPAAIDAAPLKVCDYSDVAHSIFHQVCLLAGYTLGEIVAGAENHATVLHCAARAGEETYREFLDGLLSEHSLVLDDDGLGRLTTRRWTRADPGYDMILDGDDLSVVEPVVWARRYIPEDGVRLEWSEAKVIDDALLFRDSLPVSAQGEFTGQPIAPGDYYPADSDIEDVYQDYVERWLDRPYLERATRLKNKDLSLITTDQAQVVFQAETGIVKESEAFEWGRAKVRFQNVSASIKKMLSFEVRGRALIRSSIKSITAPENAKNPKTVTSRFLFNEASAIAYANAQALDIEYADFEYTFGLNRYLESGTVVRLINQKNNIDTRAIIQDCEFDIGRPVYRYKAIGLAEESSVASTSSVSSGTAAWPYLNSIDAKMASYAQNVPPTNNVTNLAFSSEQNPSGMIDVTVSWDYTQGASPADGFLIFYKRDVTTPGAIDIFRDPSVFVQAGGASSYQTILTLPARQAGAGTLPIHYRFGVAAFGTRRSGTVVHLAGVVEDPEWIDKTFASKIQVDGNNFWDQDTGEFKSVTANGDELHIDPATGITLKARLLQLEVDMSRIFSMMEFYKNRDEYDNPQAGYARVAIGNGELGFDGYDTAWKRVAGLKAIAGKVSIQGTITAKVGSNQFEPKTRTQIAANANIAAMVEADVTRVIAFIIDPTIPDHSIRIGTVSGDVITWGAKQYVGPGAYLYGASMYFVTSTRWVITFQPASTSTLLYYYSGTYSGGVVTIDTVAGLKTLTIDTVQGYISFGPSETLGVAMGAYVKSLGDGTKRLNLVKIAWDDSTKTFSVSANVDSGRQVDNSGYAHLDLIGGNYLLSMAMPGGVSIFDIYSSSFEILTRDLLSGLGIAGLVKIKGRLSSKLFLLRAGTVYYLMHADNPTMLETVTVPNAYGAVSGATLGNIAVGLESTYYTPILVSEYQMADLGAGIIESGQNSNGSYVKFSDGTMIQHAKTAYTGAYAVIAVTFPASFVAPPTVAVNPNSTSSSTGSPQFRSFAYNVTAQAFSAYYAGVQFYFIAIGRWKL